MADSSQPEKQAPGSTGSRAPGGKQRSWWLLLLAALIAVAAGSVYLYQWQAGLRGMELLEFTAKWICAPLGLSMVLVYLYSR